ncbi:hypothetical protein BHT95_06210 [Bacillus paralicheniformis]|nr:hypothetical protein BHT95_06210 [Bacillus paralicheniformis]
MFISPCFAVWAARGRPPEPFHIPREKLLTTKEKGRVPAFFQLFIQLRFSSVCKLIECVQIVYSKVSKHFTVYFDTGKLKTVHQTAVRKTVHACCSIDTSDPQFAEIALFLTTVAESVVS